MRQLDLGLAEQDARKLGLHPGLSDAQSVLQLLTEWHAAGWLRLLDLRFARFLHDEQSDAPGLLLLAAALTSHQLGRGHVCLDLGAALRGPGQVLNLPPEHREDDEAPVVTPAEVLGTIALSAWEAALHPAVVSDGARVSPLVYEHGRLYLYRYWRYEQRVAAGIAARLLPNSGLQGPAPDKLRGILDVLFGVSAGNAGLDWQRLACALAARQRFAIVTGGPGTGKTTTVLRLLALLQSVHFQDSQRGLPAAALLPWQPLRIRLAAPTGKAAARLSESISGRVRDLPLDGLPGGAGLGEAIPTQVVTLHRLLGGRPHVHQRKYHADNPLPLDVLVIDEASMVPLSDMAAVIAALPAHAQLILIGDKDQLASVEAGAVLGELCSRAAYGHYLPSTQGWLAQATGMELPQEFVDDAGRPADQAVAMLRASHRFGAGSGIGRLAAAVNEGRAAEALALLDSPPRDLAYIDGCGHRDAVFGELVLNGSVAGDPDLTAGAGGRPRRGYGHYLDLVNAYAAGDTDHDHNAWAAAVLQAQRSCQILCVLRNGDWGVEGLNTSIARILQSRGRIPAISGWYPGRPLMVTRNNPALRLTNGDIGVVLPYPTASGDMALRVAFPGTDGTGVRWFAPNRLDDVETVYALTVHKSQGSEFEHAVLILPPAPTPVLTRELLYTGITRASAWFTLVNPGGRGVLTQAIDQRVYRSGGLGDLLAAMG